MKKTDIAMIILVASLSALVTYFVVKATPLGKSVTESVKVKTIEVITADVEEPDERVFNEDAVNPAVGISIDGEGSDSVSNTEESSDSTAESPTVEEQ